MFKAQNFKYFKIVLFLLLFFSSLFSVYSAIGDPEAKDGFQFEEDFELWGTGTSSSGESSWLPAGTKINLDKANCESVSIEKIGENSFGGVLKLTEQVSKALCSLIIFFMKNDVYFVILFSFLVSILLTIMIRNIGSGSSPNETLKKVSPLIGIVCFILLSIALIPTAEVFVRNILGISIIILSLIGASLISKGFNSVKGDNKYLSFVVFIVSFYFVNLLITKFITDETKFVFPLFGGSTALFGLHEIIIFIFILMVVITLFKLAFRSKGELEKALELDKELSSGDKGSKKRLWDRVKNWRKKRKEEKAKRRDCSREVSNIKKSVLDISTQLLNAKNFLKQESERLSNNQEMTKQYWSRLHDSFSTVKDGLSHIKRDIEKIEKDFKEEDYFLDFGDQRFFRTLKSNFEHIKEIIGDDEELSKSVEEVRKISLEILRSNIDSDRDRVIALMNSSIEFNSKITREWNRVLHIFEERGLQDSLKELVATTSVSHEKFFEELETIYKTIENIIQNNKFDLEEFFINFENFNNQLDALITKISDETFNYDKHIQKLLRILESNGNENFKIFTKNFIKIRRNIKIEDISSIKNIYGKENISISNIQDLFNDFYNFKKIVLHSSKDTIIEQKSQYFMFYLEFLFNFELYKYNFKLLRTKIPTIEGDFDCENIILFYKKYCNFSEFIWEGVVLERDFISVKDIKNVSFDLNAEKSIKRLEPEKLKKLSLLFRKSTEKITELLILEPKNLKKYLEDNNASKKENIKGTGNEIEVSKIENFLKDGNFGIDDLKSSFDSMKSKIQNQDMNKIYKSVDKFIKENKLMLTDELKEILESLRDNSDKNSFSNGFSNFTSYLEERREEELKSLERLLEIMSKKGFISSLEKKEKFDIIFGKMENYMLLCGHKKYIKILQDLNNKFIDFLNDKEIIEETGISKFLGLREDKRVDKIENFFNDEEVKRLVKSLQELKKEIENKSSTEESSNN